MPTSEALLSLTGAAWADTTSAVADGVRLKLGKATAYSIAACHRRVAEDFLENLKQGGAQNIRLMPAPWVALAAGSCKCAPRSWKVFVQVILAQPSGLAVLMAQGRPVLWRRFACSGEDSADIVSAIRHLQVYAKLHLPVPDVAGVAVLGPSASARVDQLNLETALTIVARDDKRADEAEYSRAMAVWARSDEQDSLDLLRSLRPPPTLKQMFPRKLVAIMAAATVGMGFFLYSTLSTLKGECRALKRQNASYSWAARLRTNEIDGQRKQLMTEVASVQQFLSTRVLWSNYFRDLPTRLPQNACLTNITGSYELEDSAKKNQRKASRSLTLRGQARFSDRGSAPKEIDAFLDSLREMSLLKENFPLVNVAEVKWRKDGNNDIAIFTVIAMPPEKKSGPSGKGSGHSEK